MPFSGPLPTPFFRRLGSAFFAISSHLMLVMATVQAADTPAKSLRVYLGTYTGQEGGGIHVCELDLASGNLSPPRVAAELVNPSFLALHPDGKHLYAVGEIDDFNGKKTGGVSALEIEPASGALTLLNQQSSGGAGPCHLIVDNVGKNVLVANYGGGSVACLPIAADGKLGPASSFIQHQGASVNKQRQEAPHAHSINLDAAGKFAVAADLGLDKLLVYRFDSNAGKLAANDPPSVSVPPGGGPRHFAFHPGGKFAYTNNEITSTVSALRYDAPAGKFEVLQSLSTLPHDVPGNSTAEVRVHPTGKFVYVSNRGHNSVAIFSVDAATGKLTAQGHQSTEGKVPRNFNLTPDGRWLLAANQDSANVVVFAANGETGELKPTGQQIEVPRCVCVRFAAAP